MFEMKSHVKLLGKHYYSNPVHFHNTGDIWKDLPSFNLLKSPFCSGIVITPACDLANYKVESVTYLPIVPIKQWLCSRSFYQVLRTELLNIANLCSISIDDNLIVKNALPKAGAFNDVLSEINLIIKQQSGKKKELYKKLLLAFDMLERIVDSNCLLFNDNQIKSLFGEKRAEELIERILKNSYANDIHFLPKDEQNIEWSAIQFHSIALFRYPISVPIEIFDLASDINCSNWDLSIDELSIRFPISKEFKAKRPLKSVHLNKDFLSDLLTRFLSLYIRLGSPDFTDDIINEFKSNI